MFAYMYSHPLVLAAVALAVLASGWLLRTLYAALASPLRSLPGPWYTHFTHLMLKRATIQGRRVHYITALHDKYGSVVRVSPQEVICASVSGFKTIHSVSSHFEKSQWYEDFTGFPKLGVFTMRDWKDHANRRKVVAKGLSKTFLREHWESMVRENTRLCVDKVKAQAVTGEADLLEWLTFLALDVVGHLGFGEGFGMVKRGERTEYIRVLEKARVGNGVGAELPLVRTIGALLPSKAAKETFAASDYILGYAQRAIALANTDKSERNYVATMRSEAVRLGVPLEDSDVRIEATNLIFAGSGTVSLTLTFLVYAVLSRPSIQAALEEEVAKLGSSFDDAQLENLPLMNAVIEETLRLYCAVPGTLPRVVPEGGVTIDDHYIPAGKVVSTQAWTLHRDGTLFPDPLTFNPSRWLPSAAPLSADAKAAYCAFGAGASSCLGVNLARMEMRYAVAFLFRECRGLRLSERCTPESMEPVNFFVITPRDRRLDVRLPQKA